MDAVLRFIGDADTDEWCPAADVLAVVLALAIGLFITHSFMLRKVSVTDRRITANSGQYLPGFTIMRLSDYPVPPRAILGVSGAIGTNLRILSQDAGQIEASTLTFLTTASGVTLMGLGSAFWGVVVGLATHWLLRPRAANQGIS